MFMTSSANLLAGETMLFRHFPPVACFIGGGDPTPAGRSRAFRQEMLHNPALPSPAHAGCDSTILERS
jgi:hypothetical protein